jgi:hypothetical protein
MVEGKPIVFYLPNGFKGIFVIEENPRSGLPMVVRNGMYEIVVPARARVSVQSLAPFSKWHKELAYFWNGASLPAMAPPPVKGRVAVYNVGNYPEKSYLFVGTAEEYHLIIKYRWSDMSDTLEKLVGGNALKLTFASNSIEHLNEGRVFLETLKSNLLLNAGTGTNTQAGRRKRVSL